MALNLVEEGEQVAPGVVLGDEENLLLGLESADKIHLKSK